MNTYNWIINAVECKLKDGDLKNIILIVHWKFKAINKDGIISEIYGSQSLESPNQKDFISFDDITSEQVIGWLEESMDIDKMKLILDKEIDLLINPEIITLQLKK